MKPITDEIVTSLIARAERRGCALRPANLATPAGETAPEERRIIALDLVRRHLQNAKVVSGFFCYSPQR